MNNEHPSATPTSFSLSHFDKMKKGIELFNQQKYWECHEALEHCWLEDAHDTVRNVYWAIIQVAAGLIHYREGNLSGAKGLIGRAREKLKRCETFKVESPLLFDKLSWKKFKNLVEKVPEEPTLADFDDLFHFRFD